MTSQEYLDSLIAGQENSSIPVQVAELKLLKTMMQHEQGGKSIFSAQHGCARSGGCYCLGDPPHVRQSCPDWKG